MLSALRPKLLSLLLLSIPFHISGQGTYPSDYFRPPVDIRLLLSGTFGELRSNHFHSGIDIKTNGQTGEKVYAIADGYVSRINVSAFGFGKALYINHPNGYTSVYAHLDYFTGPIHRHVIDEHYRQERFEMTLYPEPGALPVKKGDLVGYSGNSGSSAGPHLHFEIRHAADQVPVNPLLFGFEVKDHYRPRITRVKIYAAGNRSQVNGKNSHAVYNVEGWGEDHRLVGSIRASGLIGFGVQCYDQQNDTQNKNGIYSSRVLVDGAVVSETRMESFPFSDTRYINSYIDYSEYASSGIRFQRTEVDPGSRLKIYDEVANDGLIYIDDTLIHQVRIELADVPGNLAVLEFTVQGEKVADDTGLDRHHEDPRWFRYDRTNRFEAEGFILEAPEGAYYRDFYFDYEVAAPCTGCLSPVHHIHNKYTPIHDPVSISIRPAALNNMMLSKALIIRLDGEGNEYSSAGGSYDAESGMVRTSIREFGKYSVAVDTIPPTIRAVNAQVFKSLKEGDGIRFKIKDELSGINSYRGTVNGKWILMEHDAKNDLLFYYVDGHLEKGPNNFRLEVKDNKANSATYEAILTRQ